MKNLYINGCSFTAGDRLGLQQPDKIWPKLLSDRLDTNLINHSENGSSMQTITFNSVNYLSTLNSEDTLVVIGLTWKPRYMVQFGEGVVNVTPAIVQPGRDRSVSFDRIQFPYIAKDETRLEWKKKSNTKRTELFTEDKYPVKILDDFSKYYNSLIKYDYNLEENQKLNLITNIVYLQSYLKQKNFKYKFIDFGSVDYTFNLPIINELDKENIILIKNTPYRRNHPRHPTEKECIEISKEIYDSINR